MSDFWGDFKPEIIKTPNKILKEISEDLSKITNNFVYADIQQFDKESKNMYFNPDDFYEFNFAFIIKSKYMDNYSFKVFSIHHDIIPYPIYIKIDSAIKDTIITEIKDFKKEELEGDIIAESEDEFKSLIKIILQSKKLREIINVIYSISKQYEDIF